MPAKLKGKTKQEIRLQQRKNHPTGSIGSKADDGLSLALRRTRREPKVVHNAFKDEEEAQLELAIKLSLQAQRAEEHQKKTSDITDNSKALTKAMSSAGDEPVRKRMPKTSAHSTQQPTTEGSLQPKNVERHPKKHITSTSATKSPTKKVKMEYMVDIDKMLKKEEIPSTASFISYVLQKGSNNRDMDLVKLFEREESHEELNSLTNAIAESESDWENS